MRCGARDARVVWAANCAAAEESGAGEVGRGERWWGRREGLVEG
jgi:hypothetical protein